MKKAEVYTPTLSDKHNKDTHYQPQLQQVVEALKIKPQTMLEVAQATCIERAGVCRYIATLLKQNQVQLVKKYYCPITHHVAGFYTTDKSKFIPQTLTLNFEL